MDLFTKDRVVVQEIIATLTDCHCCSRCILRYLGLKDMYEYKGDRTTMDAMVQKLKKFGSMEPDNTEAKCVNGEDSKSEAMEVPEDTTSTSDTPDTSDILDTSDIPDTSNTPDTLQPSVTMETADTHSCQSTKQELDAVKCEGVTAPVEADVSAEKNGKDQCDSGDRTDVSGEACVDGEGDGVNSGAEQMSKTHGQVCVVCLGVLEQFAAESYVNKIQKEISSSEFTFATYMCSLMLPVCTIMREHALMLHLKDKFPSVYGTKKYTDVATVKDVWKWKNGPILNNILNAPFDMRSPFEICLTFQYKDSDKECSFLLDSGSDTFRKRKLDRRCNKKSNFALYNRMNVTKALEEMSEEEFRRNYLCPPKPPTCPLVCDLKLQQDGVFVAGRYNKYSRFLSQTPWLIDGVRKFESSVEELLCTEINKLFKPSDQKFSSSGREDVDVLMLGDGRPFVLELLNPKRRDFTQEEVTNMQKAINAATKDIRCSDLQIVTREDTERLKEGETDKIKHYTALCWSKQPVSDEQLAKVTDIKDLVLMQKTPVRVLHRRPLATRDRMIHSMSIERVDEHHFRLDLSTQAGTYVKEFVHGDFGRTKPNLSTILGEDCDILQLDVKAVELDWPKKILDAV